MPLSTTRRIELAMTKPLTVEINCLYSKLTFSTETIESLFAEVFSLHRHDCSGNLSVVFLDRVAHSKIHGDFLRDFRPTDVITFPSDPAEELAGEICISVDQAIEESKERSIPLSRELTLYLIHGWLHLVGFDDKEEEDRRIMRREEEKALSHVSELDLWPDFLLDSTHV